MALQWRFRIQVKNRMPSNKAILLVGGAGYLGCVLVEELLARGYDVAIFDRLFFGDGSLKRFRDRVRLVAGDMRAMPASVLDNAGAIINLGGLSNDPTAEYNPEANYQMNTEATRILGEMAREAGIRRYIYASSCSIYDVGVIDEERDVVLTEEAEVNPRAAYARSKLEGEQALFSLAADTGLAPVILRMGTLFGFSARMRYDLVVNTFVKDAISKGRLSLHYGGQMWRPLVDVRDAARAYIVALEAEEHVVAGQIFNIVADNYRISELALRVRQALAEKGIAAEVSTRFEYTGIRNYRVSGKKILKTLDYKPLVTVEDSVKNMVDKIREYGYDDFDNPRYYNIRWMKVLEEVKKTIDITGTIFEVPASKAVAHI